MTTAPPSLLEVSDLHVRFATHEGTVRAVEGLTFEVRERETVAIVGESGCGKSVTSMALLRLLASPPAQIQGSVRFEGGELLALAEPAMRRIRGNRISMIFQEPMTSLNPVLTIGRQIAETVSLHQGLSRREAIEQAVAMLERVRIPEARRRVTEYPHQLSGGMRQRVMIAIALACNPRLLIADEPTTALDVTMQAQILDLMRELRERSGTATLLITHDLGVVAEMAERVIVMYAGRMVEESEVHGLFEAPAHPYTKGLLGALPRLGASLEPQPTVRLAEIPGHVPSLRKPIVGCAFAERCAHASTRCRSETPAIFEFAPGRRVACHHPLAGGPGR
jgi:peptide/nickel transport system ATP-binding protein